MVKYHDRYRSLFDKEHSMRKIVLRLGYICYGVSVLIIVGGALLLHRGSDVSRLEALLMAFIFFSVVGYVLAGPPWPRRAKKR